MATIRRQGHSQNWYAVFRDGQGKQRNKATGVPDVGSPKERADARKRAQAIADGFERVARGESGTEAMLRKTLAELSNAAGGPDLRVVTAQEYLSDWLDRMRRLKESTTFKAYNGAISEFLAYCWQDKPIALQTVSPDLAQGFLDTLTLKGLSSKTLMNKVKILRIPFREAVTRGHIERNPFDLLKVRVVSEERTPFTMGEINALVTALPLTDLEPDQQSDWQTLILLGAYCGMRLGDAANLRWRNVDLAAGLIRFLPEKTRSRKKEVVIPIHPRIGKHLMALPAPDDGNAYLCPALCDEMGGRTRLNKHFHKILAMAGVDSMPVTAKQGQRAFSRKTFHSLRHTFASLMANAGIPAEIRMKMTGHSDADVHSIYTHLELAPLRAAIAALPE